MGGFGETVIGETVIQRGETNPKKRLKVIHGYPLHDRAGVERLHISWNLTYELLQNMECVGVLKTIPGETRDMPRPAMHGPGPVSGQ